MKIIIVETALPSIATVRDWAGVIPIAKAENTATASAIPKEPGVIENAPAIVPIETKKKAWLKVSSIPKI